jgi:hypothetical protein
MYTKVNGYGEIQSITKGFSNNQQFNDANHVLTTPVGEIPVVQVPGGAGGGGASLPTPDLNGAVANSSSPIAYEWSELKSLAQANLSANELRDTYGIEVGDYKEVDGTKYVLVDLGCDDDVDGTRDNYAGFVFMYNSGKTMKMNSVALNKGGYGTYAMSKVEALCGFLNTDLKSSMKAVNIKYNEGNANYSTTPYHTTTEPVHLFLASYKEVGLTSNLTGTYADGYNAEGAKFDLFVDQTARANFATLANISSFWWLRSAYSSSAAYFHIVTTNGNNGDSYATATSAVVPAFVIG